MRVPSTGDLAFPTPAEASVARDAVRRILPLLAKRKNVGIRMADSKETIALPALAVRLLVELLSELAAGRAVKFVPLSAELTTQQAAELLGVSRPFFVEQLETGRLPFHKVGTHRRVSLHDVSRIKALICQAETASDKVLAAEIGKRAETSVKHHRAPGIDVLGRFSPRSYMWTSDAIALLGTTSDQELARRLGISAATVCVRRHMLGIAPYRPVTGSSSIRNLNIDARAVQATTSTSRVEADRNSQRLL